MTASSSTSGGAAAAGGFDFQAALGAIAYIHMLRGTPTHWTDSWTASPPTAVSFETAGPGDDISLTLADGSTVEVQARKGLRASGRFWSALDSFCEGIDFDRCDYGVLAVCPQSSLPVRKHYALALRRLGDKRGDHPSAQQAELARFLADKGYDAAEVCSRIRIKTVSALIDDGDAVAAARSELGHVCAHTHQVIPAWNALYRDALSAISTKGRRTMTKLISLLRTSQVELSRPSNDAPVAISASIIGWTMTRTQHFEILGVRAPLLTDRAWLPLKAVVRDGPAETASSVSEALAAYQAIGEESKRKYNDEIDARTIGTFRGLCVVIGGPGSGKSLLLEVLAREFAKDSFVSLRVRLRDLARRIERDGCTVEEGIFALGLDGSGISPEQLRAASLSELVILCDGLDECGDRQSIIASGLRSIAASHPSYRIVVTTRPIGYSTSELRNWRHYDLVPFAAKDVPKHLEILCRAALGSDAAGDDHLRDRVKAYLREDDAARTLARTPLLLALGASLFLRWQHPGRSKSELYARIFKLIDDLPSPRKGETPAVPTRAVRDGVLNELGWQVVASPLLASDDVERRCAKNLRAAMGTTYLQALSDVQQSINYWEAAGLVERLSHAGLDLIAFVHKTCGEFAAARHLAAMDPERARTLIRDELSNPDSEEILDFATQTPLATTLAEMLTAEIEAVEIDPNMQNRLLRILARPETSLSSTQRRSFLERLFDLVQSADRQKAYSAGLCLIRNDLGRLPEAEGMASRLRTAPAEWSRLVGWAVLCTHFPRNLDHEELEDAFNHFGMRSTDPEFFVQSHSVFGPLPERDVFEEFLIGVLRCLLPGKDPRYQDWFIDLVHDTEGDHFIYLRFHALLQELGREDAVRQHSRQLMTSVDLAALSASTRRIASVLSDVVSAAFLREPPEPLPETGLKFLSAFQRMSGMLDSPLSDIHKAFPSGGKQLTEVHALFRTAASVFDLPAERLAAEARCAVDAIEALAVEGKAASGFEVFPAVDAPEAHWERAVDLRIDDGHLETLVHHPSGWVSRLAGQLLHARLDEVQRVLVCERILRMGKGDGLLVGAWLAIALPDHRGQTLVLRRLGGRAVEGLHHLFDLLREDQLTPVRAHLHVLEKGLLDSGAKTAESAARWCQVVGNASDAWMVPLLERAMDHWLEHEDPYPVGGGLVPDSPREALLRTLFQVDHLDLHQLAELSADARRDVSNAAIDCLIACAIESPDQRKELVELIAAKRFPMRLSGRLLDGKVPYSAAELARLSAMRNDAHAAVRAFVVRRVIVHPGMDPGEAASTAALLKGDQNGIVRDAAYRFLDSATRSA